MEHITLPVEKLHTWDKNNRTISNGSYYLLKDKLEKKRQFKPLFVTPDGDGQYTVLAGNMRLKAYQELQVESLWVSILVFVEKNELWYVEKDGVLETEAFKTKEDAMLDWALSDNEEFGENNWDEFVNDMDGYNLDWTRYLMSDKPQKKVSKKLNEFIMADKMEKKKKEVTCPSCGHIFEE